MWEAVSLYRNLFERGATLEEIIKRERIEVRRQTLPNDVPSMQMWVGNHSVFIIDTRLKDTDYRRAIFHELYHHFRPSKQSADPAHPNSHDYLARVFAEISLQFYGHAIPPMGRLELTLQEIDKTLEFN